jgi:hypothetical protein
MLGSAPASTSSVSPEGTEPSAHAAAPVAATIIENAQMK